MEVYSENRVRKLYAEFRGLKKYSDKLSFFDRYFGIVPFPFPDFDPELLFFFQREKTEELYGIFKKERNNPGLFEKKFSFGENFVFSIRPANSNSAAYSIYILTRFLSRSPVFEQWIPEKKTDATAVEKMLDHANGIINHIESCLQNEHDKSFSLQCMSVFYKGFYDAFSNGVTLPDKKRKFTELFLYAQGIIYANYVSSLKTIFRKPRSPVELRGMTHLDLPDRLELLQELGIIDFLKSRFTGLDSISFENKIAELVCLITGELPDKKELITKMLSSLNRSKKNGIIKFPSAVVQNNHLQTDRK
jgi:hypothetical protein